ncbi:MAG TPA: hypothetical protein PLB10_06655 [Thiolinea sp.]|nr:hypothetical protein [Thiolinea sp.]
MLEPFIAMFDFLVANQLFWLAAFMILVLFRGVMYSSLWNGAGEYPESMEKYKQMIRVERWGEWYLLALGSLMNWLTGRIGDRAGVGGLG